MAAPKSSEHQALGAALRAARGDLGLTLEALGGTMEPVMNPRYISAVERGEINVSLANLLRLCRALDVLPSTILQEVERSQAWIADN